MSDAAFLPFEELLEKYFERDDAEAEIERRYLTTAGILVCDFTGMVKRTVSDGIVYSLALARAAERVMEPAVEANEGEIVKRVADTFFAVFKSAASLLQGALDARKALEGFNEPRTGTIGDGSKNERIDCCMGLGFGPMLINPGQDLYGDEVNRAFVLGEDVADAREILVTDAFVEALGEDTPAGISFTDVSSARIADAGFSFRVTTGP
ncbi:MAG: nucleotidyl cyclase domain-containing protein [Planctomycetota bacterium]|jgi:class 3 adenylate cyclase